MHLLQSTDIFAFGIGLDIGGGYLIARGLLVAASDILRRSLNDEHYFIPEETASLIADRVDAQIGLVALLFGFAVQAAGYGFSAASVGGVLTAHSAWARAGAVCGASLIAVSLVIVAWKRVRWRFVRRLIIAVASDPLTLGPQYWITVGEPKPPSAARLEALGSLFGHSRMSEESSADYATREFGLTEVSEVDPLATAFHPARLA
jgi:hypothetical protein